MEWTTGLKLLSSINFNGEEYHLTVLKVMDIIINYYFRIVKGNWQLPWDQQIAIVEGNFPDAGDLNALLIDRLSYLNKSLAIYFEGSIPVTFIERLEAALSAWKFTIKNGIPQIE